MDVDAKDKEEQAIDDWEKHIAEETSSYDKYINKAIYKLDSVNMLSELPELRELCKLLWVALMI